MVLCNHVITVMIECLTATLTWHNEQSSNSSYLMQNPCAELSVTL